MLDTLLQGKRVTLRNVTEKDFKPLWQLRYGEENPEWKKWDAPYFPYERLDFHRFKEMEKNRVTYDYAHGVNSQLLIEVNSRIIGSIVFYWEDEATRWLEIGIAIYKPKFWNGGYGTEALELYIDYLFSNLEIERVGLTTWSGNERMIAAGKKVGLLMEGRMRKCRYYNGYYYDSIRMGMIREEWEEKKKSKKLQRGVSYTNQNN
ncbi:N-acetyltransferase [Peribacillus cavernae]|uniref:N-acetyltransferase n=1 Tax=Peribacillus cavernae TaxID=1674310 RepID=A0A433HIR2_9BACI|nr:GNAT family protein [Peribacillus cavernae]MDQ0217836.1 RimJ/RimL family protein N-acetyltransferase [Peribacillus cavernae]RUQ28280.1 N-acetyltransferase [Peribacillus cavernae]